MQAHVRPYTPFLTHMPSYVRWLALSGLQKMEREVDLNKTSHGCEAFFWDYCYSIIGPAREERPVSAHRYLCPQTCRLAASLLQEAECRVLHRSLRPLILFLPLSCQPCSQFPKFDMVISGCASAQHESSAGTKKEPQAASDAIRNYCDTHRHLSQCTLFCFLGGAIYACWCVCARATACASPATLRLALTDLWVVYASVF